MIPLLILTYLYGAFLTAYLLGRFQGIIDEFKDLPIFGFIVFWPIFLIFFLPLFGLCTTYESTRRRYWK